jgi:type II secretory pathway pseudopilin PulG
MNTGEKSVPAIRRQGGAALLIFAIILVMGALTYLLSGFSPDLSDASRERKTQEALAQAREALIGYALQYREQQVATGTLDAMYGYLPMPDVGTSRFHASQSAACNIEGCAMTFVNGAFPADTETIVGRLPWRTLGLDPIRDGHGECLWYIISANHKNLGISTTVRMNWDTLSHLDVVVANGGAALAAALASAHERPVAVIFSPGPPLTGQDRTPSGGDDVSRCGGNYDAINYLDPSNAAALGGPTNYLAGTNKASAVTDIDTNRKPLSLQGRVFASSGNFLPNACQGGDCTLLANDKGLQLTGDALFGAIRKNAYFRTDINSMLDRITDCLRDSVVPGGYAKISGADANTCYGSGVVPLGYYPNYREMLFVAGAASQVNGSNCAGALLLSNQRNASQQRITAGQTSDPANYLEGINLANFGSGTLFSGQELFERVSATQTISQDIVRCIPSTRSFETTTSPGLVAAGLPQMASYDPGTRTITLGQTVVGSALSSSVSNFLYGSAWRPEKRTLASGLRSYFTFRINDVGGASWPTLGFTFALADGDNNDIDASGAAAQHLGYSGNNTESPFIVPPKIAFEIDPRRETGFNPAAADHLLNGRNDPLTGTYRGGHVAIDYWGGETAINTTLAPPCTAPAYDSGGTCYLPQEEDDNVHARAATSRSGFPAPPANPAVPAVELSIPPDAPAGVYKLDPTLTSTPTNTDFHVRVELRRSFFPSYTVVTAANININSPGNPINGVTLSAGDRVWARYQTAVPERGFYTWNGAAVPMTRISDDDPTTDYDLPRVRVATTANIADLNNPATDSIDSVYLTDGDRVLVKNQTVLAQNGVYVWKAAGQPMTRASDADTAAELTGLVVEVQQGVQNAGSIWRQNTKFPISCPPSDPITCNSDTSWTNYRVKLAAPSTTSLAGPGTSLDGIRMKSGDRVFVKNNGVYIWNGAAVPMTLAPDIVAGSSIVQIQQGSEATALWAINGAASQRLQSVRVVSQTNLNLVAPGGIVDGVAMLAGDRVLVKNQTNAAENGIYVWNGAAIPMTRAADADAAAELAGAMTQSMEGSQVGRTYRQIALAANGAVGTDTVQWMSLDRSTSYLLEIWILPDSVSYSAMIAAMKDTTRPMSLLYPTFSPHLQDRPVIPYPFRNVRPGFTIGQRTSINDQTVTIGNFFTTWLE